MSHLQKFTKTFKERVTEVVRNISKGQVMTYSQVAMRAGVPKAARAVGTIMSQNTDKQIPCHRVVKADGKIGGYNGLRSKTIGSNAKMDLLKKEGIKFTRSGRVNFE